MSKTIWKYTIQITDVQTVELPENAKILCVKIQYDIPTLWALVDPTLDREPIEIVTFGTGQPDIETDNLEYIDTYLVMGGDFVGHVFKRSE